MAKTILVVEDNELNLQLMVAILGHYGYEVLEARNGAQAMLIVRRQPITTVRRFDQEQGSSVFRVQTVDDLFRQDNAQ